MRRLIVVVLLLAAWLVPLPAHSAQAAGTPDPGVPGPYPTMAGGYTLDPVTIPGLPRKVEMHALVVAPIDAPGPRPLVLFLHGRHETCRHGHHQTMQWPCPAGATAIPSYRGYRYAQLLLASQGYDTVSISANSINGQDGDLDDDGAEARSALIRLHLAHWADWTAAGRRNAPAVVRAAPHADLSRVLLVGHSRGGEGVEQAAVDTVTPMTGDPIAVRWRIRGVVLIAPTSNNQNPEPDVPSLVLLPGCDGDVTDLSGQMNVDATRGVSQGAALHSAIYITGADHNYFSTQWSKDDFTRRGNAVCSAGAPTRLTRARQRAVARTYIAAAAGVFVAGDDRFRPLLDGSGARAASAGPAVVHDDALGAGRTPLVLPGPAVVIRGARLCIEVAVTAACLGAGESPNFARFAPVDPESGRFAIALAWSKAGGVASLRPPRPLSLAGDSAVDLRIIVPPNTAGTRFGVVIVDRDGRHANLGDVSLDGLPADGRMAAYWGQEVRVPLTDGVDRWHVAELRLIARTRSGRAWLLDAWGWRPGLPAVMPVALPRIDLGSGVISAGRRRATVPVTVSGAGSGTIRLWVAGRSELASRLVTVHAGERSIPVPWMRSASLTVLAKAVRGVLVGRSRGRLRIRAVLCVCRDAQAPPPARRSAHLRHGR
jgi:hypothetical protein